MKVTETQIMRNCSVPGQLYSIDASSVNAGIPYADSFYVELHYCMKRTTDDHTGNLHNILFTNLDLHQKDVQTIYNS